MRAVLRYEIPIDDAAHPVPYGPIVLATPYRRQGMVPRTPPVVEIWILVDDTRDETMAVQVFGTGHEVPSRFIHGASCRDDPFIWHVFYAFSPVED